MMWQEFEQIAGYEVSYEDYTKYIEPMYMAVEISKQDFVKMIDRKRFEIIPRTEKVVIKEMKAAAKEKEKNKMTVVEKMRKDGWPLRIIGNDGYKATLVDMQPLFDGDYLGIYRYPGGDCCMDLEEIKQCHTVMEW